MDHDVATQSRPADAVADRVPAPVTTAAARAGVVAMLPYMVGLAPLALVLGAAIATHDAPWAGWLGVWPIFGGSAHLATIRALDAGPFVAVVTGLAVNARVAAYGFAVAGRWHHQPRWFRLLAPCLLVDPTFATSEHHAAAHDDPVDQRRFFVAAGLSLGLAFWAFATIGVVIGGHLDAGLGFGVAVPLCLLAPLGPRVREAPLAVAAMVGALVIVVSRGWPSGTGMLVAVVAGAVAGLAVEARSAS